MTIYALSTGPGVSGVAIIRISGSESSEVIKSLTGKGLPKPRLATLRKINKINSSELIDEGLIIWFPGPESYTGQDMAEIHVHGGKAVIQAIHHSLSKIKNCRLAEPGEFTKLAFQNGKINLLKAESVADLISAETEIQRRQAIQIMNGKSADKFNDLNRVKLPQTCTWILDTHDADFVRHWSEIYDVLYENGLWRDQIVFSYTLVSQIPKIKYISLNNSGISFWGE
mgnify:CR=1 FL=1